MSAEKEPVSDDEMTDDSRSKSAEGERSCSDPTDQSNPFLVACNTGATYLIGDPEKPAEQIRATISDEVIYQGTKHEIRRPYELLLHTRDGKSSHWLEAMSRLITAIFQTRGAYRFVADEMMEVFNPKGPYTTEHGYSMSSAVAHLGHALAQHFQAYTRPGEPCNVPELKPVDDAPDLLVRDRPQVAPGATYRVDPPLSDNVYYVTINSVLVDTGDAHVVRRPFEVFINSRDTLDFQWSLALTRLLSAVLRQPHDPQFIIDELKTVQSPEGGYFSKEFQGLCPSVTANIGALIEKCWDGGKPEPKPGFYSQETSLDENTDPDPSGSAPCVAIGNT